MLPALCVPVIPIHQTVKAEMIKEIVANLKNEVDNIIFGMDSGYFSEEIAEVIENVGYQYVVKAKEYSNMIEKVYKRPVKIWEDYGYQKQAMFCYIKPDKWDKTRKFAVVRELNSEEGRKQQSLLKRMITTMLFMLPIQHGELPKQ